MKKTQDHELEESSTRSALEIHGSDTDPPPAGTMSLDERDVRIDEATVDEKTDTAAARVPDSLRRPLNVQMVALVGLLLLGVLYTAILAKEYLAPVVVALVLQFVLSPVVRGMETRLRLPRALSAALLIAALVGAVGFGVYQLSEPALTWMSEAPKNLRSMERKANELRKPVEQVNEAAEQVEKIAGMENTPKRGVQQVEIKEQSLSDTLMASAQSMLVGAVIVVLLLYFFLACGDHFLRKMVKLLSLSKQPISVDLMRNAERQMSAYLATVAMINGLLGLAVAIAMYLLGVPNALLWGVMAALFNFVPYLGAIVGVGVVGLTAAMTFDSLGAIILPPAVYLALTALEGMVITPMMLGRRLALDPVVIILWLLLWGWMWGVPGTLLAVPLLAVLKIFSDHFEPLEPLGELLSR